MLRDLWRFLWRRDSEAAACLMIHVAQSCSERDLRIIADYLDGLADDRQASQ